MSRDLPAALATEVAKSMLRPFFMVEALFDSGTVRLWSGIGNITVFGQTWTGAGNVLGFSSYEETSNLQAQGINISLSGISTSLISLALAEPYQGRECRIYLGAFDQNWALVSDPYQIFAGIMDVIEVSEGGDTCTLTLQCESKLVQLTRTKERRYTSESQKADYPGDKGFDFVTQLQDQEILWKARA